MKLILVRHGETDVNASNLTHKTGVSVGLNEKGKILISETTEVVRQHSPQKVYCSPEKRCIESAQIISNTLNLKFEITDELGERNWGDWEGRSWDEIKPVLDKMALEERYTFIPPKGESWKQMEERIKRFLQKLEKENLKSVCVVTHAGTLRGMMPILKREPKESSFKYEFQNASVTVFEFENGRYNEIQI